jgi:hypothetical protein
MIRPEQIPDEAQQAGFDAWCKAMAAQRDAISAAIAAAINAWTHAERRRWTVPSVTPSECDAIILPIMTPLGADFEKVWDENAAALYEE